MGEVSPVKAVYQGGQVGIRLIPLGFCEALHGFRLVAVEYAEHVQGVASRLLGELGAALSRRAISPALYAACEKLLKEVR